MKIKYTLMAASIAMLLSAGTFAATQADVDKAVASASAEIKASKAAGNEWRDSKKLLSKADKAAAKGDFAGAIKLANEAGTQGKIAQAQAAGQANVGNPAYLY